MDTDKIAEVLGDYDIWDADYRKLVEKVQKLMEQATFEAVQKTHRLEEENRALKEMIKARMMRKKVFTMSDMRCYKDQYDKGDISLDRFKELIDEHYKHVYEDLQGENKKLRDAINSIKLPEKINSPYMESNPAIVVRNKTIDECQAEIDKVKN